MKEKEIPIAAALSAAASSIAMNQDAAKSVLVGVLGAAGLSTKVAFAASANAASGSTVSSGTGYVIGGSAVAASAAIYLLGVWAPVIQKVSYSTDLTCNDLPVTVQVSGNQYLDSLYAEDASGVRYYGSKLTDGTYEILITDNGSYHLIAQAANGKTAATDFTIDSIDKTVPEIADYSLSGDLLTLHYTDDHSGLDPATAYGITDAGTRVEPVSTDPAAGTVVYEYHGGVLTVYMNDIAGNQSVHQITSK